MHRTAVIDVVGLTPRLIDSGRLPRTSALFRDRATIRETLPAVTCTMQSTYLTGKLPNQHGIVANGWYFRDLAEVMFWRQSNRLVRSDKIWHIARRRDAAFTSASTCWWYNMATDVDCLITPRPVYCADGRKLPDCYTVPHHLRRHLTHTLGTFPLFHFWGPGASIRSSEWIAAAARVVEELHRPTLHLVYLPHLDYALQKGGPEGPVETDLEAIDRVCAALASFLLDRGCRVVILSEYGISAVDHAAHPNRALRSAGLLQVKQDLGREYLDTAASRAFAVSDHQIAHVYVQSRSDLPNVTEVCAATPGVDLVLDEEGKKAHALDHERSGDIVLVAKKGWWFTYYFWEDDARAPDYARTVNIHAKPGYDPCELLFDPAIRHPKLVAGCKLLRQKIGFRTMMDLIPLDAGLVRGSHGRLAESPSEQPVLMSSAPRLLPDSCIPADRVCGILLDHLFCT